MDCSCIWRDQINAEVQAQVWKADLRSRRRLCGRRWKGHLDEKGGLVSRALPSLSLEGERRQKLWLLFLSAQSLLAFYIQTPQWWRRESAGFHLISLSLALEHLKPSVPMTHMQEESNRGRDGLVPKWGKCTVQKSWWWEISALCTEFNTAIASWLCYTWLLL